MTKSTAISNLDTTLQHGHGSVNQDLIRGETEVESQRGSRDGDLSLSLQEDEQEPQSLREKPLYERLIEEEMNANPTRLSYTQPKEEESYSHLTTSDNFTESTQRQITAQVNPNASSYGGAKNVVRQSYQIPQN